MIKELDAHNQRKRFELDLRCKSKLKVFTTSIRPSNLAETKSNLSCSKLEVSKLRCNTAKQQDRRLSATKLTEKAEKSDNITLYKHVEQVENKLSKHANKKLREKDITFDKKSNKLNIKYAISSVCLAGAPNAESRNKILEFIDNCQCENFVILFKDIIGRFVSYIA